MSETKINCLRCADALSTRRGNLGAKLNSTWVTAPETSLAHRCSLSRSRQPPYDAIHSTMALNTVDICSDSRTDDGLKTEDDGGKCLHDWRGNKGVSGWRWNSACFFVLLKYWVSLTSNVYVFVAVTVECTRSVYLGMVHRDFLRPILPSIVMRPSSVKNFRQLSFCD